MFWRFSTDILPDGYQLEKEPSLTGDPCHFNIKGLSRRESKRVFKPVCDKLDEFRICQGHDNHRPLTRQDIEARAFDIPLD